MNKKIENFQRNKKYLVCIDSDGCAIDSMDSKHIHCFGPAAVEVYELESHRELFLNIWNRVNLYSLTRGMNRFKTLVQSLEQAREEGVEVENIEDLKEWTEGAKELSNPALEQRIKETDSPTLKKALKWSQLTNEYIKDLGNASKAFKGVKEGIETIHKIADVAIVSSANSEAVEKEWKEQGLSLFVDLLMGQEAGSKAQCIKDLKAFGYENAEILMVGDAPGDLEAAHQNDVFYYPILVKKEQQSWERLTQEALVRLEQGTFVGDYQEKLIQVFYENLGIQN